MNEQSINVKRSKMFAEASHANPSDCWRSAVTALLTLGSEADHYVEGWVVTDRGLTFEHGWIEVAGEIVDPTFYGHGLKYYVAGPRWSYAEMLEMFATGEAPLPAVYALASQSPERYRAYHGAFLRALELAEEARRAYARSTDEIEMVKAWAAEKKARAQEVVPALTRIQRLVDRAAQRVLVNIAFLETLRVTASWTQDGSWLLLDMTVGANDRTGLQNYALTVPRKVLSYSEDEFVLTIQTMIDNTVAKYLGNR